MGKLWSIFTKSVSLPKRKSAFGLNRIGMDWVLIYLFLLLGIASIPELIVQLQTGIEGVEIKTFFLTIFFFIFYYLTFIFIVIALISMIAYIGSGIAHFTKRKLRYSILWKITACLMTIPILLFTCISIFVTPGGLFLFISTLFLLFMLTKIVLLYPRRKHLKN